MSCGKLWIIQNETRKAENVSCVYKERARNLYQIMLPEDYIVNIRMPYIVTSNNQVVYPINLYSSGYFTLTDKFLSVSFSGTLKRIKLWGEIEGVHIHKTNISSTPEFSILSYEFEILEFRVINDITVLDSSEIFAYIENGKIKIYSTCIINKNWLKPNENILFLVGG